MTHPTKSDGFAHQGLLLLLVVVAAVAAVGYRVYSNQNNTSPVSSVTAPVTASTAVPAKITSKADLEKASKALDADPGVNPGQLNSYITGLL